MKFLFLAHCEKDHLAHNLMGLTKGDTFAHEIIGQICCHQKTFLRGLFQPLLLKGNFSEEPGHNLETDPDSVRRIKQCLFVLLDVLIIG